MAKHIFVTGGVASSLGKGLTASSLGRLLKARGLRVTMQKLDPYLNVDPGTMNPFEHGEVSFSAAGFGRSQCGPESTATYCLPLMAKLIGGAMMPQPTLKLQTSLRSFAL